MTGPGSWGSQDWLCVIVPFPPFPAFPLGDFVHLLFSLLCATSAFFTGCVSPMPASLVQLLGEMQSLESNRLHCVGSFFPERSSHAQISDSCLCGYVVNTFFSEPVNFQQRSHDNICSFSGGTNTQKGKASPASLPHHVPWHSSKAAAMSSALRTSVMLIFHLFTQNKRDANGKQKHTHLGGPHPLRPTEIAYLLKKFNKWYT